MKRKILWLGLSFLLVAALVLASCGEAAPGEQEEEEEEEEPAVGAPQYGGTLTFWHGGCASDPPSTDIGGGFFYHLLWLDPIQERPVGGDIEKYGPRGTGEYAFQLHSFQPEKFMKGILLESWDVTVDKIVWKVRQGIMWQGRDVMESRELTAEDVVADLEYLRASPGGARWRDIVGDIYTTDRYTLVLEFALGFDVSLMYSIGYEDRALISPPEIEGSESWEDQVGTGPWMFKEYVVGSHMAYERNPDYWDTTTINGVEYQLPFIDKLVSPIIPDMATQMAALRTGMLDFQLSVPTTQWENLDKTAPDLLSASYSSAGTVIALKTDEPPFDDVNVRRAMMIGTDMKAFAILAKAEAQPRHWWPMYTGNPDVYIPMEELSAEDQLLYEYNPELAMQMLADAGYPDGFGVKFYAPTTPPDALDFAALLEDQWAKLGVEVEIVATEVVAFKQMKMDGVYTHSVWESTITSSPIDVTSWFETGHYFNITQFSNERYDELVREIMAEPDAAKRNLLIKESSQIIISEVPYIPATPKVSGHYWWPWIKNYYGELGIADGNSVAATLAYAWIDQDLKAEMGY